MHVWGKEGTAYHLFKICLDTFVYIADMLFCAMNIFSSR